jgi:hypothetical protein
MDLTVAIEGLHEAEFKLLITSLWAPNRNQPTLCISQMKKARSLFFTISKRWLRSCPGPNGQPLVMRNFFIDGLRSAIQMSIFGL